VLEDFIGLVIGASFGSHRGRPGRVNFAQCRPVTIAYRPVKVAEVGLVTLLHDLSVVQTLVKLLESESLGIGLSWPCKFAAAPSQTDISMASDSGGFVASMALCFRKGSSRSWKVSSCVGTLSSFLGNWTHSVRAFVSVCHHRAGVAWQPSVADWFLGAEVVDRTSQSGNRKKGA
jgi:hypothetical protein